MENNNENLEKNENLVSDTNNVVAENVDLGAAINEVKTKENSFVTSQTNNINLNSEKTNKKSKLIPILMCLIGIICIGVGAFLFATNQDGKGKSGSSNSGDEVEENKDQGEESKDDEEEKEESNLKLIDYSSYKNYKFVMDITMEVETITVNTSSIGHADVLNKKDMMTTTVKVQDQTQISYSYSDYSTGTNYTSIDNVTWTRDVISGTESINLKDIIDKINENSSDVNVLEDNHYLVKVDFAADGSQFSDVYADVYVSNGYITKLYYDLSSVAVDEGYTKFTIGFELSDFNEAGNVVIPQNVISSAV